MGRFWYSFVLDKGDTWVSTKAKNYRSKAQAIKACQRAIRKKIKKTGSSDWYGTILTNGLRGPAHKVPKRRAWVTVYGEVTKSRYYSSLVLTWKFTKRFTKK